MVARDRQKEGGAGQAEGGKYGEEYKRHETASEEVKGGKLRDRNKMRTTEQQER